MEDPALAAFVAAMSADATLTPADLSPALSAMPAVIGVAGAAGAGKDTVAAWLCEHRGFTPIAFAAPLRAALAAIDPWVAPREVAGEPERLSAVIARVGYEVAKRTYPEIRRLLQALGTDVGREMIEENLWVRLALENMTAQRSYVFSDVRFSNEAAAIKALCPDNVIVEVKRPGCLRAGHASEMGLTEGDIDMRITNSATIPDLHNLLALIFPPAETP